MDDNKNIFRVYKTFDMSLQEKVGTDIVLEFLEVVIHTILYYRQIYPKDIFNKKEVIGLNVYILQDTHLNGYIKKVLASIKNIIQEDILHLQSINLLHLNRNKVPTEKFTCQLQKFNINKLDFRQQRCIVETQQQNKKLCNIQEDIELHDLFSMLTTYYTKLMNIKQDVVTVHEKISKLKRRALRVQLAKQKEVFQTGKL
ncbi:uncharacterized protein LOC131665272 isoform X2 [Phymastichus coffea]|uniref:uncharacterized protein LOC131665272 isoform X2 n=1 Tax=Phymastichus coffea TaxID=108790 RepID=UPI00273A785C|nr:uncharacterized protein LOC131665272 isoform X2 [Phymastichus coffea]